MFEFQLTTLVELQLDGVVDRATTLAVRIQVENHDTELVVG